MRGTVRTHWKVVAAACLASAILGGALLAAQIDEPKVKVENRDASVVLYTIYRGSYDKIGADIGGLFALAGQKGIIPQGPVTLCYLNNPEETTPEHYLTEVRIPVSEDALDQAGKLGPMTDVKKLSAMTVVVTRKPAGSADPASTLELLFNWIRASDYEAVSGPMETFTDNAETGDYAQMETEVAIPVRKIED